MNKELINKLTKKWLKTKSKLQKVQAKERHLRLQLDEQLSMSNLDNLKLNSPEQKISLTRKKNYSIPAAAMVDIKANIPAQVFTNLFTTSYRIKPAVYNELSGNCKNIVKGHLTIKDAPLSITVKEV